MSGLRAMAWDAAMVKAGRTLASVLLVDAFSGFHFGNNYIGDSPRGAWRISCYVHINGVSQMKSTIRHCRIVAREIA